MDWQPGWDLHIGAASTAGMLRPLPEGHGPSDPATEIMEDMALLEQVLAQLVGGDEGAVPDTDRLALDVGMSTGIMPHGTDPPGPADAMPDVGQMLEQIARDTRLLPAVRQAVKSLEPALLQLAQTDARFFTDGDHPARRLLDTLTQRSLAFTQEATPGFSQFMHLTTQAVQHLSTSQPKDADLFGTVLDAWETAWDAQEQQNKDRQKAERRKLLAGQVAAEIRALSDIGQVPADILDFATGPWADVVALAQLTQGEDGQERRQEPGDGENDDPQGYRRLIPALLWSAQPGLTRQNTALLNEVIPALLAQLRAGLVSIDYPPAQTSALLQRLVGLHQAAFEEITAETQNTRATVASQESEPGDPDPYADFVVGAWVDLTTNDHVVRTQLTWASPQGTLFMFTAPDSSTQSMTRRMRNKLASEGLLRVVPADAKPLSPKGPGKTRAR
ncbi:DUF1631 domain-containing protein [Verminephrobacter eiseniae]|uniref:DUF1631 domain-containing protein n=1 Tax=Verminephrobacter eiseniae TaxID=364317 RepID=UPI0022373A9A|nr:DUF1631 domain-containing protein [Verminephrobacter eiseniae]